MKAMNKIVTPEDKEWLMRFIPNGTSASIVAKGRTDKDDPSPQLNYLMNKA